MVAHRSEHIHQAFSKVLILAQCFGQMPIQGITSPTYKSLKFTYVSLRTLYSILLIVGAAFVLSTESIWLLRKGLSFADIGNT